MAISPRSTARGEPGGEPGSGSLPLGNRRESRSRARPSPGIAMTALAPGRGRERSAQRRRGGGCRRGTFGYHFARGGDEPPPRSPPPPWRYPHGPLHGESSGKNQIQASSSRSSRSLPGNRRRCRSRARFIPDIVMTALAPSRGRGRSAQRGRGGGCRRGTYEYPLQEGRAGWGDGGERSVGDGAKARYGLFIWNRSTTPAAPAPVPGECQEHPAYRAPSSPDKPSRRRRALIRR